MKLYHGTSFENYQKILENGFRHTDTVWDYASDYNFIYFWNPSDVKKAYDCETLEDAVFQSKLNAADSAKVTAAIFKSKIEKIVILEIEVNKKFVTPDDSCENMEGAVKVNCDNLSVENIKNVFYADFIPSASLLYLVGLVDNRNIDLYNHFSDIEISTLKSLSGISLPEEFYSTYDIYE